MVIRSEANIRKLLDRVNELLRNKEILRIAAADAAETYRDSSRATQLTRNDEIIYQISRLSLAVTKDTLNWVLEEQNSSLNQFMRNAKHYEMPELKQNDLILKN